MATVAAMMTSAATRSFAINGPSGSVSASRRCPSPLFSNKRVVQIRCNAEPGPESKFEGTSVPTEGISTSSILPTPILTPPPTIPAPNPEVTATFFDVFRFTGPGPEVINGRLAMLGFVSALGAEVATGKSLSTQLSNGGVSSFVVATVIFSVASLIPLSKGVTPASRSKGFFSSTAETWNGRAAMIGLVALAITEFVNGSALV